jgi:hypothetical protein
LIVRQKIDPTAAIDSPRVLGRDRKGHVSWSADGNRF